MLVHPSQLSIFQSAPIRPTAANCTRCSWRGAPPVPRLTAIIRYYIVYSDSHPAPDSAFGLLLSLHAPLPGSWFSFCAWTIFCSLSTRESAISVGLWILSFEIHCVCWTFLEHRYLHPIVSFHPDFIVKIYESSSNLQQISIVVCSYGAKPI